MKKCSFLLLSLTIFLLSCKEQDTEPDAYGNFEAIEVIVSAETQGRILDFKAKEGSRLEKDQVSVRIDTTQLFLKKAQLESGRASLRSREKTLDAQIRANHVQMNNLKREKERMEQLVAGGAATSKQLDDLSEADKVNLTKLRSLPEEDKLALFRELFPSGSATP